MWKNFRSEKETNVKMKNEERFENVIKMFENLRI